MRRLSYLLVVGAMALATVVPVAAQGQGGGQLAVEGQVDPNRLVVNATEANQTRQQLRELMRKYPPSLARVLRLDPTLLTNDPYLQTYPELRNYLRQHPEVPRAPDYFLSFADPGFEAGPPTAEELSWNRIMDTLAVIAVMVSGTLAAVLLLWLIRHLLSHRRWLRATKIQTDLQNKLIERLTSSDDVRTFLQALPASKFLAEVPSMDETSRSVLPVSRILRSVQAGVTLVVAGILTLLLANFVSHVPGFYETGVLLGGLATAIGLGLLAAAAASYVISKRLGLLPGSDGVANDRA